MKRLKGQNETAKEILQSVKDGTFCTDTLKNKYVKKLGHTDTRISEVFPRVVIKTKKENKNFRKLLQNIQSH